LAHIREMSNGHVSARGRPIHFMFGSTVGFSGSADRVALFPVSPNPRWRLCGTAAILKNSNGDISAADHPINSVFGSRMGLSGSADFNGANSGLTKFNRYVGENNARGVIRVVTI